MAIAGPRLEIELGCLGVERSVGGRHSPFSFGGTELLVMNDTHSFASRGSAAARGRHGSRQKDGDRNMQRFVFIFLSTFFCQPLGSRRDGRGVAGNSEHLASGCFEFHAESAAEPIAPHEPPPRAPFSDGPGLSDAGFAARVRCRRRSVSFFRSAYADPH